MVTITQADRWLELETPLGENQLVPTHVAGREAVSALYEFRIEALSPKMTIEPAQLLGKNVTLSMAHPQAERRIVNGIVTAFSGSMVTRSDYRLYTLIVSPDLWLLQRSSDYRIFQQKTPVEIIEAVLGDAGISFEKKLRGTFQPREYCVQFGETHLAFIERLMAEEGIFYYFTHAQSAHKLVLTDHAGGYADCAQAEVAYRQNREDATDAVFALDFRASLTDTEFVLQDYKFETPDQNIEGQHKTTLAPASQKSWSHFRYPGGSVDASTLKRLSTASVDAADAGFETLEGQGTAATFTPGHRFTISEHAIEALQGTTHVLTEVEHVVYDRTHFTYRQDNDGKPSYRNSFRSIPSTRIARSPVLQPRPRAGGPQTALVVGPAGDEIHTDAHGRIRIQFFWDRYGKKNETSSCYVRVAQTLAGANWGSVFIPRIGMEVVVNFLDGNPDRPLVTGTVYNGTNTPPWALPANMTKSGLLTRSSKQGQVANANELSFDDKKGSEKIVFHAEKDFVREVENDDTLDVGHDQTRTIKNDRTTTISEGNETYTLKKGNRTEKIETGHDALTLDKGNRTATISQGNETLTVTQGDRTVKLDAGNDSLTLAAGNQTTKAQAGKITLDAAQGVVLKCGANTVEVTPQGIKVNGVTIGIQAQATVEVKGAMASLSGDGMTTLKGGMIKIN